MREKLMKDLSDVTKAARTLKELSGLALLAAFLLGSCCATTALSMRRTDVKVFQLGQRIPRNSRILDILNTDGPSPPRTAASIGNDNDSDSLYCSYRPIIRHLKKRARAKGGDAIAILHVQKPFMWYRCFWIKAFLLDMIDISDWPRVGLREEEIRRDLDARGRTLDDIEGIWASHAHSEVMMDEATRRVAKVLEYSLGRGAAKPTIAYRVWPSVIQAMEQLSPEEQSSYRVAIVRADGDPYYPYAAYILDPEIPEWQAGFLKARLRKIPDSTGYEAKWYGSTFQDGLREFHSDETGALKAKVVVELGLKYSIEQTLTKVYPPTKVKNTPD
jgi:hypothetical protein